MLKIAVCDDEPLDLNRIQDLVSEYIKAVSYTHLDVYKRQYVPCFDQISRLFKLFSCGRTNRSE